MAAAFDWSDAVPEVESRGLDTTTEGISLNLALIRSLVEGLESYELEESVRLLVAHEVWHFVALRRGNATPGSAGSEQRRLYECEADLMAGRYLTLARVRRLGVNVGLPVDFRYTDAERIAAALWRVNRRDGPAETSLDYPKPQQRAMAAQFGALTVVRDRPGLTAEQRQAIDGSLGFESGISLADWSRKACERLTHFGGEALMAIGAGQEELTARDGGVEFRIPFINASRQPIEVSMTVLANYWPRGPDGSTIAGASRQLEIPQHFTIPPGETHYVTGMLAGIPGRENLFLSYRPDQDHVPFTARFAGAPVRPPVATLGSGLSPEDQSFGLAIQRLAVDARYNFARHKVGGASRYSSGGLSYQSAVNVPGTAAGESTRIDIQNDGAASVNVLVYSGDSREAAMAAYAAMRSRFARIWPSEPVRDVDATHFTTFVTRFARVECRVSESPAYFSVWLRMTPNVTGVIDP